MTSASDVPPQRAAQDRELVDDDHSLGSNEPAGGSVIASSTTAELLFAGPGPVHELLRATDWSRTALGPVDQWPLELTSAIRTVLAADVPMLIWWGPDYVQIYNEAYAVVIGDKHPAGIGQRGEDCWSEVWSQLGPMANAAFSGQGSRHSENLMLLINRSGYEEETYWTFSYSPITAATGEIVGVLVAPSDTTGPVVSRRRLRIIRDLSALSVSVFNTPELICREALQLMSPHRASVPFAAVYLRGDENGGASHSRLVDGFGVDPASVGLPAVIDQSPEALIEAADRSVPGRPAMIDAKQLFPGVRLAKSPLGKAAPTDMLLLPLRPAGLLTDLGVLVIGRNPYRRIDDNFLTFVQLLARHISVALTDVLAYDAERRRSQALSEADEAKSRFLQDVSHEFRTPLTMLTGPLGTVLTDPRVVLPDELRASLELSQRAVLRLRGMVDALLEFARAEYGGLEPRLVNTDLAVFVRDLASMFSSVVSSAGLDLQVDTGSVTEPVQVDRAMMAHIVSNLLSNAVKFTIEGSISVRLEQDDDKLRVVVADTGLGIPSDELSKIFERFYRADVSGARSREGAGIGLSLVSDLAALLGGQVYAESTVGQGSRFTVELPRIPATDAAIDSQPYDVRSFLTTARSWVTEPPPAELPATAPEGPTTGRLLLVEDNPDMRAYLTSLFIGDGWTVDAVGSVDEALARDELPDIVVADIMLPGRSGIDLVRLLRGNPGTERMPIVLLTAQAGPEAAEQGLRAGADDYVVKPFAPSELLARVRTHHELAQLREVALGEAETKVVNLQKALASNRQIGTALGIVMSRHMVTAEHAFDMLRTASQTNHRKLRDIAEDVILTGQIPAAPSYPPSDGGGHRAGPPDRPAMPSGHPD
ncbi:MAG TPA: ATP-binding protein [Jatrophihabitans sp.]|nr:ATP-binding protein [Jatrophihabitans sp.]